MHSGWLSLKFGGVKVLGISMLIASILTIVTPFFARWHYIALAVCRFFIGLAHGIHWPAMASIFGIKEEILSEKSIDVINFISI